MVMIKSWNMGNWPNLTSLNVVISHRSLPILPPNSTNLVCNKGDSRPRHLQGKGCKHWSGWTNLGYVPLWPYVVWPTLAICNFQSIASCTKFNILKKCMDRSLFPNVNHSGYKCFVHLKNIFENKKSSINSSQWESMFRPYQHQVMGR